MVALALQRRGLVYETMGNQNNRIGVGLSLIGIPGGAEMAVLELGICRKGEISELARMCEPNVRVVLNVGAAHLENLGVWRRLLVQRVRF
ncbi:hypothetical protein Scep_015910 [Stephania cephalantha]|uniref:Mur ligase central domain-containing protein n=1 Tax=Stephania cephalantha TaxID=152367 RepID=A0AAP0NS43_9MAGN